MTISHFHNFPVPLRAPDLKRSELERMGDLAKLLPMWPAELADRSLHGRRRMIWRLTKALRLERQRGRAGHWTYRLARHAQLVKILSEEREALKMFERAAPRAQTKNSPPMREPF